MPNITLRKIKPADKKYFARWWRDKILLKLTSGALRRISDKEVDVYFQAILNSTKNHHYLVVAGGTVVGHVSLIKRKDNWYETQIVIGDKKYWGKGYGSVAIKLLIKKAQRRRASKIYLEVRPNNNRAIRVYEKRGFKKVRTVVYPKSRHLPKTVRMELQ